MTNSYNDYIKSEKNRSEKFLSSLKLAYNSFNCEEYSMIKSLWADQVMIDKIYEIIDKIISILKLDNNIRHLIMGDFLFSMTSFDLYDPSELVLKVTRSSYNSRICMRATINMLFGINYDTYITVHKKLLTGLRKYNVLERSVIRTKDEKNGWVTLVYFRLNVKEDFLIQERLTGISYNPYVLLQIYSIRYFVSSFRNIWKIKTKRKEMEDVEISYDSIERSSAFGLVLCKKLYDINFDALKNERDKILFAVGCSTIDEYFRKIRLILKDKKYIRSLFLEKERLHDISPEDLFSLDKTIRQDLVNLMSVYQKILSLELLNKNIFDKTIYIPSYVDNRGRQYYSTAISPTYHIIFRHLFRFSTLKTNFLNLEKSRFYKETMEDSNLTKKFNLDTEKSYVAIILFSEVGKFFIKNNSQYMFESSEIINMGIKKYYEKDINLDFEDILYIQKIYNALDNLLNNGVIDHNLLIFRDATASGLENLGILIGYKIDTLKYLNLDGKKYCDTYQYLIYKFIEDKKYWIRFLWKGTLMTIPYNATLYGTFTTFLNGLRKMGIEYKELNDEDKNILLNMHKDFYYKIKNDIKKEFYTGEKNLMREFKYNKWILVNKWEYKVNYEDHRDKYTDVLFMLTEDIKTTERGKEANNMHFADALLAQRIIKKIEAITIHDCFGVRLCDIHELIDEINLYYSESIGKDTYNKYVIL